MNKLLCFLSFLTSALIATNVFSAATNSQEQNKTLSDKYFAQAKAAFEKKDFTNAYNLLQDSVRYNENNDKALYALGQLSLVALGNYKGNLNIAFEYNRRAANLGNKDAKETLDQDKLTGMGNTSDADVLALRSEIEKKLPSDENTKKIYHMLSLLASYSLIPRTKLRDIHKAEYYANKLMVLPLTTDQKYSLGLDCFYIALDYMFGNSGEKSQPIKAFQWMQASANLNYKISYYNLSDMYFYGYGTSVSFKKSYEMITRGNKLEWAPGDDHKKHIFSFPVRAMFYLGLINFPANSQMKDK